MRRLALGAVLVFWSSCGSGWYYVPGEELDPESMRPVEIVRGVGPSSVPASFHDDTPSYSTLKLLDVPDPERVG